MIEIPTREQSESDLEYRARLRLAGYSHKEINRAICKERMLTALDAAEDIEAVKQILRLVVVDNY